MTLKMTAAKTESGIKIVTEGVLNTTIETTLVPRPDIGRYIVDFILDRAYLKREEIVLNGVTIFDSFDANNEDYDKFIELIDNVQ
jgi:hypothetical protein